MMAKAIPRSDPTDRSLVMGVADTLVMIPVGHNRVRVAEWEIRLTWVVQSPVVTVIFSATEVVPWD
jgi:hypothetical protein